MSVWEVSVIVPTARGRQASAYPCGARSNDCGAPECCPRNCFGIPLGSKLSRECLSILKNARRPKLFLEFPPQTQRMFGGRYRANQTDQHIGGRHNESAKVFNGSAGFPNQKHEIPMAIPNG